MKNIQRLSIIFFLFSFYSLPAQIQVNDLIPDTIVNNNEIFYVDLNNDGVNDLKFVHEDQASGLNGNGIGVALLHTDAEFMGDLPPADPTHYYPYKLNINTLVDSTAGTMQWVVKHPDPDAIRVLNLQFTGGSYAGQWVFGVSDHYLGVRVKENGQWFYGWILMDVAADATQMAVKAWAMQSQPDVGLYTGEGIVFAADTAQLVLAADSGNVGNASDIWVHFTKASDESAIDEYRAMVVPASIASFMLSDALKAQTGQYLKHIPNNTSPSFRADSALTDYQGNKIVENQPYVLYVLSVVDSSVANTSMLSKPSPVFQLQNTSGMHPSGSFEWTAYQSDQKLVVTSGQAVQAEISLFNLQGQHLCTKPMNNKRVEIDINRLPKGIYVLRIHGDGIAKSRLVELF